MSKRKRKRDRSRRNEEYPGWVWMIFGLTIGLSVAFAIFVNGLSRMDSAQNLVQAEIEPPGLLDNNGELAREPAAEIEEGPPTRFDFYNMLPNF